MHTEANKKQVRGNGLGDFSVSKATPPRIGPRSSPSAKQAFAKPDTKAERANSFSSRCSCL